MENLRFIAGFSKLDSREKARLIAQYTNNAGSFLREIENHMHPDSVLQRQYMEFSENTLSNYFLPYGVAPNFLINNQIYHVPMVTEESSVVAAAASAAKFWSDKGGFSTEVKSTVKKGQIHFQWSGAEQDLHLFFAREKNSLLASTNSLTENMRRRGGGIRDIELLFFPEILPHYYQLDVRFETADAMGANFINSCLERIAWEWKKRIEINENFSRSEKSCELIMSILSNYSPECIVSCRAETDVGLFNSLIEKYTGKQFVEKFSKAVQIAQHDIQRAVTHNKGIFNGTDAVILATGNDFRAVEANGHAYAARHGVYRALSEVEIQNDRFIFSLELPMMVGTVGGVTSLHPLAKCSLEILGNPAAADLMQIAGAVGLATNFSAIRSLISGGIQAGHMKMHLSNIMKHLGVTDKERSHITAEFSNRRISFSEVRDYLSDLRSSS